MGPTIADGLQIAVPGALNFAVWAPRVRDLVAVEDAEVEAALRTLAFRGKLLAEPSGVVALAAALSGRLDLEGRRVGVLISGGNAEPAWLARVLAG